LNKTFQLTIQNTTDKGIVRTADNYSSATQIIFYVPAIDLVVNGDAWAKFQRTAKFCASHSLMEILFY
jgi:hypothetical protein